MMRESQDIINFEKQEEFAGVEVAYSRARSMEPRPNGSNHEKGPVYKSGRTYIGQNGWDIMEFESESEEERELEQAVQYMRVKQNFCFYVLTLVSTLMTGMENIYVFITREDRVQPFIFIPSVTFRIIFSLVASYSLCTNPRVLAKLYFTIDKLFVSEVIETVAVFAYVAIYLPYCEYPWFYKLYEIIYPIMIFSTTGYIRVILIYGDWKPLQVIAFKICLMIGAISFFAIGIFYTVTSVQFTNGQAPEADKKIKNIIFLFIFAGFTYFSELFDKLDSVDGTADFRAGYKLECNPLDMEVLLQNSKRVSNAS